MSKPFSFDHNDFVKGLALAVIIAFVGGVQQGLTSHGFDLAAYDWPMIGNLAVSAFVAYLMKNFVSDENGAVITPFGKVGGK